MKMTMIESSQCSRTNTNSMILSLGVRHAS
jgi:hypothetical protein